MLNRKIAIIDEDRRTLGELEEILTLVGYYPVPVFDPLMAVDTVIQNKPDIILMELRMSRKSGFELTHTINQVFEVRKVPIIAMSETYKDEYRWFLDFCGIKGWVKKPLLPLNLIWAIENVIEEDPTWEMEKNLSGMEMVT